LELPPLRSSILSLFNYKRQIPGLTISSCDFHKLTEDEIDWAKKLILDYYESLRSYLIFIPARNPSSDQYLG
jgi:hypothetical protein